MEKKSTRLLQYFCYLTLLMSCQTIQSPESEQDQLLLSSDNGQLDLSLSSLEQQKLEKAAAEKFLLEARQKRTVVEPQKSDDLDMKSKINIALYARQTSNEVGERIYGRLQFKEKKPDPCLRFVSSDDAQKFFLEKNGPERDFWNLDPDGDGFACDWDPERYRKLIIN